LADDEDNGVEEGALTLAEQVFGHAAEEEEDDDELPLAPQSWPLDRRTTI
jgi:hypothetical protein